MLRLWGFNTAVAGINTPRTFIGVLREAAEVAETRQINGDYTLSFKYPRNGEFADNVSFRPNSIVECEGQLFRIKKMTRNAEPQMNIECEHIFNCDAKRTHIHNIASTNNGDFIGEDAYKVLEAAAAICSTPFHLMSEEELAELGMSRIAVNIDFESMDKTNLYDVIQKIIECAGTGEIYIDNYNIAIVNRIGKNTNVTLDTARNMTGITIERDTSEMITHLYPYGKDNLEITNAGANEDSTAYIRSDNEGTYGIIEGYRDYSDYTDPDKLLERALWEFDSENPNRLDIPAINISGSVVDLSRLGADVDSLRVGDTVRITDGGEEFTERVISMTRHPYEPTPDNVSIGRVKKDMFFYLNQLGVLSKRYKSVSTNDGRIQGAKISGFSVVDGEIYYNGKKIVTEEV